MTDAAKIDGCNDFGVFRRVMLPLAGPAMSALVVFNFMASRNAFLLPLINLQSDKLRPVMTGMMFFTTRWGVGVIIETGADVRDWQVGDRVFISSWNSGELCRSGCCYHRGRGKIFYCRPGHGTLPIYYQPEARQVIANAVRWAAAPSGGPELIFGDHPPLEKLD